MSNLVYWLGILGGLVLAFTWLVYPASVYLLSLLFSDRRPSADATVPVTVVLATRDEPAQVRRRVKNVLRTAYPRDRLEVVVALDATSSYDKGELRDLEDHPGVRVVSGSAPGGKAATLNGGVARAVGEILIFTDTRQRFVTDSIPELVSAFADPAVGAASGSLELRGRRGGASVADLYWRFERWLRSREARIHSPVGVTGAISAVRSALWKPLPPGLILDDVHTPMRLVMDGHRVAFVDSAVAYETRRPSAAQEHRRKTRTLTGVVQVCAWLPAILIPWRNPIFIQFLMHKLARLLTPLAGLLVGIGMLWWIVRWAPTTLVVVVVGLIWMFWSPAPLAGRLRAAVIEMGLVQLAIVKALANGLRGRWDVWG
jgi:cellulose synthase/poly-beta-1,6-N-acetylglucosamine synthase-like glycosyltransferase